MYTFPMTRIVVCIILLLSALSLRPAYAFQGRTIVIGAEPTLYDVMVAGAEVWNATGIVTFIVEPTGCGTGHITVCYASWGPGGWVAAYDYAIGVVYFDADDPGWINTITACHELGHVLGIWLDGHRSDGLSCMTDPNPTVPYPDAADLAYLGYTMPPPPEFAPGLDTGEVVMVEPEVSPALENEFAGDATGFNYGVIIGDGTGGNYGRLQPRIKKSDRQSTRP